MQTKDDYKLFCEAIDLRLNEIKFDEPMFDHDLSNNWTYEDEDEVHELAMLITSSQQFFGNEFKVRLRNEGFGNEFDQLRKRNLTIIKYLLLTLNQFDYERRAKYLNELSDVIENVIDKSQLVSACKDINDIIDAYNLKDYEDAIQFAQSGKWIEDTFTIDENVYAEGLLESDDPFSRADESEVSYICSLVRLAELIYENKITKGFAVYFEFPKPGMLRFYQADDYHPVLARTAITHIEREYFRAKLRPDENMNYPRDDPVGKALTCATALSDPDMLKILTYLTFGRFSKSYEIEDYQDPNLDKFDFEDTIEWIPPISRTSSELELSGKSTLGSTDETETEADPFPKGTGFKARQKQRAWRSRHRVRKEQREKEIIKKEEEEEKRRGKLVGLRLKRLSISDFQKDIVRSERRMILDKHGQKIERLRLTEADNEKFQTKSRFGDDDLRSHLVQVERVQKSDHVLSLSEGTRSKRFLVTLTGNDRIPTFNRIVERRRNRQF